MPNQLGTLKERLELAREGMMNAVAGPSDSHRLERLVGIVKGLEMALSYLEEILAEEN